MEGRPRILVVDDEPKIQRLLERLLSREGYEVSTRGNGAEALKEILTTRPDLVITDLKMPEMDGLELAHRAKALDRDLPFVLITGYASMETAVQALREGISDYITKPFSLAELKGVVGRIVENRRLVSENRRLLRELKVANAELEQHRHRLTRKVEEAESDLVAANRTLTARLRDMEVIHEINQMVATVFDQAELLALSTQLIQDKVGVDSCGIFLRDAEETNLVAESVRGLPSGLANGDRVSPDEGLMAHVLEERSPLFVPDVSRDARPSHSERITFGRGALLALPIRAKGRIAGVLMVSRSEGRDPIGETERGLLELIANDLSVAVENCRLFTENERNYIDILAALVESMEARDRYLRSHSERVRRKSGEVAAALNLSERERDILETGARLHDLGKVGIPDSILHKPGKLTDEQMATMQSHPVIGDRIVMPLGKLGAAKPILRNHHERWDGGGYPDGLEAESIPFLTRIVTVADAYDALTSDRPYRPSRTPAEALDIIEADIGTHFSPFVAEVFLEIERDRIVAAQRREAS